MPSVPTGTQPSRWASVPPGATTAAGWSVAAAQRRSGVPAVSSRQQQHEHCRVGALGHSDPPRPSDAAAWPSAGRSASKSASQRPSEGLPNRRVYSRVPPENQNRCPSAPFLSAGPFRSAEPASASTAIERARERSLGRCSEPTTAPGHRATGRFRGSSGSRSTFAPATSALGPLHDPTTGYAGSPARHTLRRSVVGGSGGG